MLPWMLQSPLFPNIAILMASATQALELRQPKHTSETYLLRSRVLRLLNKAISGSHDRSDIWRCIIHIVVIEWFWGDPSSMWAHLRGLRDLITSLGGLGSLNDPLFLSVLILF